MASIKLEEQLEEQPPKKKPRIDDYHEEGENASNPNESELPKSAEGEKESTNLPSSRRHRKLPAELNCQIFYCLNLATRRKFIWGLGWGFYGMFRQILLKKSKRLRNLEGNAWSRSNGNATISEDGLNASNNTNTYTNVFAEQAFPISGPLCRMNNFPGTICYYYEVSILKSAENWCFFGLSDGERSQIAYVTVIRIPEKDIYQFLCGLRRRVEFPEGVIQPEVKETGNVAGCGLLINADNKLTIFFTLNGILAGRQIPIDVPVDRLFPTVTLWNGLSVEANFGDNPAKPFEYDIKHCPGMGLEWI